MSKDSDWFSQSCVELGAVTTGSKEYYHLYANQLYQGSISVVDRDQHQTTHKDFRFLDWNSEFQLIGNDK